MYLHNSSLKVTQFIIGGFSELERPLVTGAVILTIYVVLTLANMFNIVVIISDKKLHQPMYLLIFNLGVVDVLHTSTSCPTIIGGLLYDFRSISYVPCLIQMFVFHWSAVMEMFALAVMAFDRLLAVSCPFNYHSYLTNARTLLLAAVLWLAAACFVSTMPATVIPLPHCSLKLKYIYCDYAAVMRTTCANWNYFFNIITIISSFLMFSTFGFICLSYLGILLQIKLSSNADKKKIGSTCLSHLIVVTCYYGPLYVRIVMTRLGVVLTVSQWNGVMLGTILVPPLINPFVYCLSTKAIRHKLFGVLKPVDSSH